MKPKWLCTVIAAMFLLASCNTAPAPDSTVESGVSESSQAQAEKSASNTAESTAAPPNDTSGDTAQPEDHPRFEGPSTQEYISRIVRDAVARFETPEMSEYEKVKAAFDYMIEIGYYRRPIALDVWRFRSAGDTVPSYEEARGSFILQFGFGTCEDYAAALVLLLEEMGIEARYLTGQTYTRSGGLALHSWTQAKVDGVWYHLDCELEDGISDDGTVIYRYFMRGDETMSASHFWGKRLIDSGALTEGQNEVVQSEYMGEYCPQNYPTPTPNQIPVNPQPDVEALRMELQTELGEYESLYGQLEYMELDIYPPVFVRYWYESGEEPEGGLNDFVSNYGRERLLIPPPENMNRSEA